MQDLEKNTRNCYAEPINDLNSNEFVGMMLLDSCFIVAFVEKCIRRNLIYVDDPFFRTYHICNGIIKDLPLLENQLPFFVLEKFCRMTKITVVDRFIYLAILAFKDLVPPIDLSSASIQEIKNCEIKHLLHLMYCCWYLPPHVDRTINHNRRMDSAVKLLMEQVHTYCCFQVAQTSYGYKDGIAIGLQEFINSASDLDEAGVKFTKMKGGDATRLNITFKNGEIKMPSLNVSPGTICLLKNLIQYEMQFRITNERPASDYVKFMRCLVNSRKDVEILRHSGIIENWMGTDEVIIDALHKLDRGVEISYYFGCSEVITEVKNHCKHHRNIWMAKLWRNYFNSPWSLISLIAAAVLLLLTLTQTVYSILSYHLK